MGLMIVYMYTPLSDQRLRFVHIKCQAISKNKPNAQSQNVLIFCMVKSERQTKIILCEVGTEIITTKK